MSRSTLLKNIFLLHVVVLILGAIFKIMHLPFAEALLAVVFISALIFMAVAIYEVSQSDQIDTNERVMWVVALLFLGLLGAALYFFVGRKKITGSIPQNV